MKYLDNEICEFTPLFPINYSVKKNIVSCSFFKLKSTQYKDFNLYINGLEKLYDNVYNKYKNESYSIRLFIDKTIYEDIELFNRIKRMDKIELVLYSCPNYWIESDNKYHRGLFGTFVRFFPMFDFPNNDANIVILSDLDDYEYFKKNIHNINLITNMKNNIYFLKSGNISKNILYMNNTLEKNTVNPYTMASNYICFKQIEHKIIYNFLNKINNSSDTIFSQYKYKLKSNPNLITDEKFLYGFDEYFLNVDLTNYLIDKKIPFGVNFTWEVNGSLYWLLTRKDFTNEEIDLVNNMLDIIISNLNIKIKNNLDIKKKYYLLDNLIQKKDKYSKKILYEFYNFFIKCKYDFKYNFLFENEIYKIIDMFNVYGCWKFKILSYYNINLSKTITNEYKIVEFDKFENNLLLNLKNNLSRFNSNPIPNYKNLSEINCEFNFTDNLTKNKERFVQIIRIDNLNYIIKKELFNKNNSELPEYTFVIKYKNIINKTCFSEFILLPLNITNCNKSEIYIYEKLDNDYTINIINKISFFNWISYTLELCLIVYYLNNIIGIYHNDLCYRNELRNIMIKNNNNKVLIEIEKYKYYTKKEHVVIIDFGWQSTKPEKRTLNFYINKYKKKNNYKYISEVFIIYYYSFKKYFKLDDYWDEKYDNLYESIEIKSKSLKEFDSNIIDFLFELYEKNKN